MGRCQGINQRGASAKAQGAIRGTIKHLPELGDACLIPPLIDVLPALQVGQVPALGLAEAITARGQVDKQLLEAGIVRDLDGLSPSEQRFGRRVESHLSRGMRRNGTKEHGGHQPP